MFFQQAIYGGVKIVLGEQGYGSLSRRISVISTEVYLLGLAQMSCMYTDVLRHSDMLGYLPPDAGGTI